VHETIAAHDLAGSMVSEDPSMVWDIEFGARCLLLLEQLWSARVLDAWDGGRTSLF
jgi:hypothetical protein